MPAFALSRSDGAGGVICGCGGCPDVEELTVTFSGITECPCQSPGGTSSKITSMSVNGVYTLALVSAGLWQATGGSWTRTVYSDDACSVVDFTDSGTFGFQVDCFDGPIFGASITGGVLVDIFTSAPDALGVALPNTTSCASRYTFDGTATVEL